MHATEHIPVYVYKENEYTYVYVHLYIGSLGVLEVFGSMMKDGSPIISESFYFPTRASVPNAEFGVLQDMLSGA